MSSMGFPGPLGGPSGFVPWTTDSGVRGRIPKDPLNLIFVGALGTFEDAVDAVTKALGFGYTRLAGDQWFELIVPAGPSIHRHDASVASGRDLTDWGSRLHVRLFASGIVVPNLGSVTAGAIHRDAPTWKCGLPNEVATNFDLPRDHAIERFQAYGYGIEWVEGLERSYAQCDGSTVPTDGFRALIG